MKQIIFSCVSAAVLSMPVSATAATFEFFQDGFSDGGVLSGFFEAEDLNFNNQISTFENEVTNLRATYESESINTEFTFGTLEEVDVFLGGSALVFTLDGTGRLGDDDFGFGEGLALDNGEFSFVTGPGPSRICDGEFACGGIFFSGIVQPELPDSEPIAVAQQSFVQSSEVQIPFEPPFEDDVPLGGSFENALASTSNVLQVTSGPVTGLGFTEDTPFLPTETDEDGGFVFRILPEFVLPFETFFIDPEIAVGYTYTITGNTFQSVTAPTFGAVPDGDMSYVLSFGGTSIDLGSGETYAFGVGGVSSFTLTGIDPALALDPNSNLAFVTGVSVFPGVREATVITQTPITINQPSPVPLPAGGLLLLAALGFLGLRRRR